MAACDIVIPFYQRRSGVLSRALQSIFAQTAANFRIILVDDGSPTPPDKDLAELTDAQRERIHIIAQPNKGVSGARNTGLNAVSQTARYVAFLDSDDEWTPDHLERAMKALTAPSVDLYWDAVAAGDGFEDHRAPLDVIPQAQIFDAEDLTDAKEVRGLAKMMCGPWWRHMHLSCTVISGDLARLIRFREDLDYCEDFDFFWRICEASERAATSNAPGVARGEGDNQWHGLEMTDRRYALEKFSMFSLLQNLERSSPALDEHDRDLLRRRLQVYREQFYWAQIARLKSRRLPNLDLWARLLARDPQLAGLAASLAFKVNRNGGRTIIPEDA